MALTPAQATLLERIKTEFTKEKVTTELHRRSVQSRIKLVSRWAMISRNMKKEEVSKDIPVDFTDIIRYALHLPANVLLSTDYIPSVVLLLSPSKSAEAEWAARALWDITTGNAACRDACVSAGAVPALVSLLASSKGTEAEQAAGALWNFVVGDATCQAACVCAGAVPALVRLLSSSKGWEAGWAARTLWSIAEGDAACAAACVSAGAVPALVRLLSSRKNGEAWHAAKTLRCLVYNGYATDVIPSIKTLLTRYDISQETKIYLSLYILP